MACKRNRIVVLIVIAFVVGVVTLRLGGFHKSTPFTYTGTDDFVYYSVAKNVMSGNSYWNNSSVAAPLGQELYRFPLLMGGYILFCKLVALFGGSWITAVNLYYLLSFFVAFCTFFILGRTMEIKNDYLLVLGALAYSLWGYHYLHAECGHFTAIAYFVAPIYIAISYRITKGQYQNRKSIVLLILVSLLIGVFDIYYSFFGCFLFAVGALISLLKKRYSDCVRYLVSIVSVVAGIVVALLPAVVKLISEGENKLRSPYEAFFWALQLDSLFIPNDKSSSVLSFLYNRISGVSGIPSGENWWNYVGVLGILGIVIVCCWLFLDDNVFDREMFVCKQLGASLLLGTVGGLGIFVALFMTSSIRCYNRISVFVFALLLLAFCFFAEHYLTGTRWGQIVVVVLFLLHMFDMSSWNLIPDYTANAGTFNNDKAFFQQVDNYLEDGEIILQLPYAVGLENSINGKGNCNNHFKGYLHSLKNVGWSYGGFANTEADAFYKKYDIEVANDIIAFALSDGYGGIYLDRSMYRDDQWHVFDDLCSILGEPSVSSSDGMMYFFDLLPWKTAEVEIEKAMGFACDRGFYGLESDGSNTWNWSAQESVLNIYSSQKQNCVLKFEVVSYINSGSLRANVGNSFYLFSVSPQIMEIELPVTVENGMSHVVFNCDNAEYENGDKNARYLSFMIRNVSLEGVEE